MAYYPTGSLKAIHQAAIHHNGKGFPTASA
jgi:hypothetical protein